MVVPIGKTLGASLVIVSIPITSDAVASPMEIVSPSELVASTIISSGEIIVGEVVSSTVII